MNLGYGKGKYPDAYLLFKRDSEYKDYLEHQQEPSGGRFYARDYVNFTRSNQNDSLSSVEVEELTIETPAMKDFNKDDVLYSLRDKKRWRVQSVEVNDDSMQKRYSSNPRKLTRLKLIG